MIKLSCLIFLVGTLFSLEKSAVTYEFSGGRFGDNLLSYLHAKWISYYYEIPLLYKPFQYSSELMLDEKEPLFTSENGFWRTFMLGKGFNVDAVTGRPVLFIAPYFPEDKWELTNGFDINHRRYSHFTVDWEDPDFRFLVKESISPKKTLELIVPPADVVSIAIHVREGGDFDGPVYYSLFPLKFPPINFYAQALAKTLDMVKGRRVFCFLFTDAANPEELVRRIREGLSNEVDITFDYRKIGNYCAFNVLEDFFSLFNFDVLIRPQSNFSIIPSLIHDYAIIIFPIEFSKKNRIPVIEKIEVKTNREVLEKLLKS